MGEKYYFEFIYFVYFFKGFSHASQNHAFFVCFGEKFSFFFYPVFPPSYLKQVFKIASFLVQSRPVFFRGQNET